jgi:hypothetical protein
MCNLQQVAKDENIMFKRKTICFVTFGGSPNESDNKYSNIEKARKRIVLQANKSGQFDKCFGLDWIQLSKLCRRFEIEIPQKPNRYLFTPILLKLISLNAFGAYDYILYAGAGCEINTNYFARNDLNRMIKTAKRNLFYVEHNLLPEGQYTKKEVFTDFHVPEKFVNTPQICSTFFLVSCASQTTLLKKISNEWLDYSRQKNGFYISDEFDSKLQISNFQIHRNDQSLFSIVLKKNKIESKRERQRNFDRFFPALRGSTTFLWTNRNRTGISKIPMNTNLFLYGLTALLISPITNLRHQFLSYKRLLKNSN